MASTVQTVLTLTPVKNAAGHLDAYFAGLDRLSYPPSLISLGFLESDSHDATYDRIRERIEPLSSAAQHQVLAGGAMGFYALQ